MEVVGGDDNGVDDAEDIANGDSEDYCEWFEVYNNSGGSVNLDGLQIGDNDSATTSVSGETIVAAGVSRLLPGTVIRPITRIGG